ncbi:uncharacterized protein TNCT_433421 [Trichonephila clavata]|uniref:Uncharacterized protein n=1 Tax=Trichonephila clavata TaxID=2740835 RepID=A0A8X6IVH0_TRICU|nr:uncharacterized protein TNCT_433421 [Trichonephila clavata]
MRCKKYHLIIVQFFILWVVFNSFNCAEPDNKNGKVRRKRNIICFLGLTGLIPDLFYEALKGLHKYDPMEIGSAFGGNLQDGVLRGLSTLRNDSAIDVYCDNEKVIVNTLLGLNDAIVSYNWKQSFLFTFAGKIWTKAEQVQFDLEVTLDMADGIKLDVTNTLLTKFEGITFGFSGLGPFNPLIKILGNIILNLWSKQISDEIGKLLKDTLESELSKLTISF